MSDTLKVNLSKWSLILALATGITGMIGGVFILPYRVDALEKRQEANEKESKDTHDTALRIEERLINLQRDVDRLHR